jgi:hypothetical protein
MFAPDRSNRAPRLPRLRRLDLRDHADKPGNPCIHHCNFRENQIDGEARQRDRRAALWSRLDPSRPRLSGRPDRTQELADLALEPAAFAGQ